MGKCLDLFECRDLKAFDFLRLYFYIVIRKVQNKFVDIHKIVVFFLRVDPFVGKCIAACRLTHIDPGLLADLADHCVSGIFSRVDAASRYFPPAGAPFFVQLSLGDQVAAVWTFQHAKHRQVKLIRLHVPVVSLHRATGSLFLFIVDIPVFHNNYFSSVLFS